MAMADYLRCAVCDRKVYYDGDIDWMDRAQFVGEPSYPTVLCGEHTKTHQLVVQLRPVTPLPHTTEGV